MATNTRPSTQTDLASRYASQTVGGAYNAKEVKNQPIDFGLQETLWTSPGFKGEGENKGLGAGKRDIQSSLYRQGLDTTRYH